MRPDLNPSEQLWRELKSAVGKRHPANIYELEKFAEEEWSGQKLPAGRCKSFAYQKCLEAVVAAKRQATKYTESVPLIIILIQPYFASLLHYLQVKK